MKLTLARVRKVVRQAMEQHGIEGEVLDTRWLGVLCSPRFGNGPRFRNATSIVRSNGRTVKKHITLEDNGGWEVK